MNFYETINVAGFYSRQGKYCLLITIILLSSLSVTIAQNCGCDHYITPADVTSPTSKIIEWDGGPAKKNVQPGQTICFQAISYPYTIRLKNIKGTANARVTIKNCGGQAVIDNKNNGSQASYSALGISASEYFILAGDGDPNVQYGIKIAASNLHGVAIGGFSTDYEVRNVEIGYTDGTGFNCKTDPSCSNQDLRWFVQKNTIFHDNFIHHIGLEAIYVGYTNFPQYHVPATSTTYADCRGETLYGHPLENTKIYRNIIRDIEWDAIQLNATVKGGEIYENTISNYGTVNQGAHNHAIQLSNATVSKVYNNYILPATAGALAGPGHGIGYWGASTKIFNNVIVNAGNSSHEAIQLYDNSHPDSSVHILNNTIISTGKAAISIFNSTDTPFRVQNNILIHPTGQYILDEPRETIITNNFEKTSVAAAQFADDKYHLQSTSPCINAGANLYAFGVKFDIDRGARPATGPFDIGADEYGSGPPSGTCQASGSILQEVYSNIFGTTVATLTSSPNYPDNPSSTSQLTSLFETPSNFGDHYGQRVSGYICPPATGTYYFFLSGNDDAELWLSTDHNAANKTKIIDLPGATGVREWVKYAAQKSAGINLVAGQRYYIEALHKEGVNNDNLAVGWQLPNLIYERPIPTTRLSPRIDGSAANVSSAQITSVSSNEDLITVYPNPASGTFQVAVPAGRYYELQLRDLNGEVLKKQFCCAENVDVSDVPDGLYVVVIDDGNVITRKKLKIIRK